VFRWCSQCDLAWSTRGSSPISEGFPGLLHLPFSFFPFFPLVNNQQKFSNFTTRTGLTELSCLEGIIFSQSIMPQLDKFTYFTQFFWLCLFFFTFYIFICNDGDGVLGISRILKLRNQLVSHRGNNMRSNDPKSLEDILRKGFSTGVSYMYSSLFEVSQWCNAVDLLGKKRKITLISCFGEISGSRGMERNIFYLISKSSYSTSSNPEWGITCRNDIMLIHVLHGQGSIVF
jgi:F-type H+-transporting ATPase subunit b